MEKLLGIVLCVAVGLRLFLYIREVTHPSLLMMGLLGAHVNQIN